MVFSDFINKKFEQKDIIKDVIARYNCFVYTNPNHEKDIVFNIRDEFYATAHINDYTHKKDYNTRAQKARRSIINRFTWEKTVNTIKQNIVSL